LATDVTLLGQALNKNLVLIKYRDRTPTIFVITCLLIPVDKAIVQSAIRRSLPHILLHLNQAAFLSDTFDDRFGRKKSFFCSYMRGFC
jgi:hypothetical protein